eukprot:COSAG02_NODE_52641_length_306_cov_1.198068_1_plen_22_part_10
MSQNGDTGDKVAEKKLSTERPA